MIRNRKKWMLVFVTVLLLSIPFGVHAFAIQYTYDDLDRVISAEDTGQTTSYQYDPVGNLLSATSTTDSESLLADETEGAAPGWTAYATVGVQTQYGTVIDAVYGDAEAFSVPEAVYTQEGDAAPGLIQHIEAGSDLPGGANVYKDVSTAGQSAYELHGRIRAERLEHAAAQVIVNYYDAGGRLIGFEHAADVTEPSAAWSDFDKTLTVPAGATKLRIHLQVLLPQADGSGSADFAAVTLDPLPAS